MGVLALLFLTFFTAVIIGAVLLIQLGGWLAILSAILIIFHFFVSSSILVCSMVLDKITKKKGEQK